MRGVRSCRFIDESRRAPSTHVGDSSFQKVLVADRWKERYQLLHGDRRERQATFAQQVGSVRLQQVDSQVLAVKTPNFWNSKSSENGHARRGGAALEACDQHIGRADRLSGPTSISRGRPTRSGSTSSRPVRIRVPVHRPGTSSTRPARRASEAHRPLCQRTAPTNICNAHVAAMWS